MRSTSFTSLGDLIKHCDQLEVILDGLPEEYNALDAGNYYRFELCPIIEAESMFLLHEAKLEKANKVVLSEPFTMNVAQGGRHGGNHGHGSKSGGRSNTKRLICNKGNHNARDCYYRNSTLVVPPWQRPPTPNPWQYMSQP
ncbi:hypothetical protein L195_g033846 [Trifolium pratense]|uniref:Retrovirus-related Pol polyprotein from transposon TNT 1-94 n=1 Tax=Trifolium pratense TaxID=57577 RepID=A0A2K3LH60_TRIPR|nr:hypothetical protein L195_g033846 [Trifolium pratense]